jgi:hypothetical protein
LNEARIIRADGITVPFDKPAPFKLEDVQAAVGGYVELVHLQGGLILLVDEEGKLKHKRGNLMASAIAGHTIVGDVLLCRIEDLK